MWEKVTGIVLWWPKKPPQKETHQQKGFLRPPAWPPPYVKRGSNILYAWPLVGSVFISKGYQWFTLKTGRWSSLLCCLHMSYYLGESGGRECGRGGEITFVICWPQHVPRFPRFEQLGQHHYKTLYVKLLKWRWGPHVGARKSERMLSPKVRFDCQHQSSLLGSNCSPITTSKSFLGTT